VTLVNQLELAGELDVSKQYIGKLVKKGVLKLRKDGKLDRDKSIEAVKQLRSRGSPEVESGKEGKDKNETGKAVKNDDEKPGYWDQQTRLAKHKADIAEMESLKMAGQLVDVDVVAAEFGKFAFAIRQRFLGMGARLAPQIAKKPPAFIKLKIDADVDESLNDLTRYNAESGECEPAKPARKSTKRRAKNGAKAKTHRKPVGKQK